MELRHIGAHQSGRWRHLERGRWRCSGRLRDPEHRPCRHPCAGALGSVTRIGARHAPLRPAPCTGTQAASERKPHRSAIRIGAWAAWVRALQPLLTGGDVKSAGDGATRSHRRAGGSLAQPGSERRAQSARAHGPHGSLAGGDVKWRRQESSTAGGRARTTAWHTQVGWMDGWALSRPGGQGRALHRSVAGGVAKCVADGANHGRSRWRSLPGRPATPNQGSQSRRRSRSPGWGARLDSSMRASWRASAEWPAETPDTGTWRLPCL